ncbi:hypothetical protein [Embleya sp. NPDC020630]|uniref:hypothetical protein n=1 Tax=Embleya sp. NPDC020630 TaxID=3363979 RepID=UPI00378AD11C
MITSTSVMSAANVIGADVDWAVTYRLPTTRAGQVVVSPDCATLDALRAMLDSINRLDGVTDVRIVQRTLATAYVTLADLG